MSESDILLEPTISDFQDEMDKLDKLDVYGILDMMDEPPISVINRELDKAVKCYQIRRKLYPRYTW